MKEQTENEIQAAFFQWLALHEKKHPELSMFYAIPNGSHKSPAARGLFKRTGLKAGVPDVHLPRPGVGSVCDAPLGCIWQSDFHGLWIEFKSKKGKLSSEQATWLARLRDRGHRVEVCRSWTEAANITIDYLNLPIEKV